MKFRISAGRISVVCYSEFFKDRWLWISMDYFDNSKVVLSIYRVFSFLMKLTGERISMIRRQFLKPVNPLKVL